MTHLQALQVSQTLINQKHLQGGQTASHSNTLQMASPRAANNQSMNIQQTNPIEVSGLAPLATKTIMAGTPCDMRNTD